MFFCYVCIQIATMIKCICINDKNKPTVIPRDKWVVKGNQYHIIHIGTTIGNISMACTLKEITLGKECYPYEGFSLNRFAFNEEDIPKLMELLKNCSELNNIEIPTPNILEHEQINT